MSMHELQTTINLVKQALQKLNGLSVTEPYKAELPDPVVTLEISNLLLTQSLVRLEILKDQISVNL